VTFRKSIPVRLIAADFDRKLLLQFQPERQNSLARDGDNQVWLWFFKLLHLLHADCIRQAFVPIAEKKCLNIAQLAIAQLVRAYPRGEF
jgi:hypothetical protein